MTSCLYWITQRGRAMIPRFLKMEFLLVGSGFIESLGDHLGRG
jgi:hypothetical protein